MTLPQQEREAESNPSAWAAAPPPTVPTREWPATAEVVENECQRCGFSHTIMISALYSGIIAGRRVCPRCWYPIVGEHHG